MKELEYPFDGDYIISKKKRLKRTLLEEAEKSGKKYIDKKIAILGGVTTSDIKLTLELFLLNYGIRSMFYESEYNQYYQDAMFDNKELEEFKPDIIYVCTSIKNVTAFPTINQTVEDVDNMLNSERVKYAQMWQRLSETYHCSVIQNNFEMPYYRLMGNKDASDIHGHVNYIMRLNQIFNEYAQEHENFYICDLNYISADYGLKNWADQFYWHMYKYPCAVAAIPYLSYNVANIIKSLLGKNKKGLVLDLDNTLWGGIVGDDGVDNLEIGPEESVGQAYLEFQRYLKLLKQFGLLLNVDSKNDMENALEGLKHPDGALNPDDFIVIKANWQPKDRNFLEIAQELNILTESLVFIDDNPAERAIVKGQLPDVSVPEIGTVTDYIRIIDHSGYFEITNLSADDVNRVEMYKENMARASQKASFENYTDYLLSLEMRATIKNFESIYMSRIAQLTNKSNQFNLTTHRYTQAEIEEIAMDQDYITLYGKLEDKFGDNGVVTAAIGHCIEKVCHIELWLMSCRVLKRDMEFAMMDTLVNKCKQVGIKEIRGYYYPTSKNNMVRDFYSLQGFEKTKEDEEGNSEWQYVIPELYENKNNVIQVEV